MNSPWIKNVIAICQGMLINGIRIWRELRGQLGGSLKKGNGSLKVGGRSQEGCANEICISEYV